MTNSRHACVDPDTAGASKTLARTTARRMRSSTAGGDRSDTTVICLMRVTRMGIGVASDYVTFIACQKPRKPTISVPETVRFR